jgi:hypothetical protein
MRALMLLRPSHPIPTFVTMANAPLPGQDGGDKPVIWIKGEAEYFCEADWTRDSRGANHFWRLARKLLVGRMLVRDRESLSG